MMTFFQNIPYQPDQLIWIAVAVFLMGMSKGGMPVGPIALQMMVLMWPGDVEPARNAVAFMLPMLCAMDIVAVIIYRRDFVWEYIRPLLFWSIVGIIIGSVVFISQSSSQVISDKKVKLVIGLIGMYFVFHRLVLARVVRGLESARMSETNVSAVIGFSAGFISSIAHAAGPIYQMYLLPKKLMKINFAATTAMYFFIINIAKLAPFTIAGRITAEHSALCVLFLPVIPVGVVAGYYFVKVIKEKYYVAVIYAVLFITSLNLIAGALK